VVGGMLAATFVATVFVPLFFVWLARRQKMGEKATPDPNQADIAREHP
jgi:HAE1 family hydrophobic/amphiphilic exporter-1/multidrug efflux pump